MPMNVDEVRREIGLLLAPRLKRLGMVAADVRDDESLLGAGIFDSVSFLELINTLEEKASKPVDFSQMDPEEFTTIHSLVQYFSTPA